MATIEPFAALRPRPDLARRICELPYDVMSTEEARALAAGNPLSFLHVSKPEIDLPPGTDPYSAAVYQHGREQFLRLQQERALLRDSQPGFHLYRQILGQHAQVGVVATFSCAEYREGTIRRHELTRPDKEDDRARHVEALGAQTGPAFLTYRAVPEMDAFVRERTARMPDVDFVAADGVRHTAWSVFEPEAVEFLRGQFARVPRLYIADGHHRTAAANRVSALWQGRGGSDRFLAVVFPDQQVQILPYHRVLKDWNGQQPTQVWERIAKVCALGPTTDVPPRTRHELAVYAEGAWRRAAFRPELCGRGTVADSLDVALLQRHILGPVFGIDDPRTSQRLRFVGGIRGTHELERLVDSGSGVCAFALHPTQIDELMAVADAEGIMPPKSTWFEPKLRDGMFCYLLEREDKGPAVGITAASAEAT